MNRAEIPYTAFSRTGVNALPRFGSEGDVVADVLRLKPNGPSVGLYVHIPFCRTICEFCMLRRGAKSVAEIPKEFIAGLQREIALSEPVLACSRVGAIYFGGGTPSMLAPAQVEVIFSSIRRAYQLEPDVEITFEGEAQSLARVELLHALKNCGVQRVSFGLQTFDIATRKLLGRTDSVDDLIRLRENLEAVGFDEINVDYLYCLPGSTMEFVEREIELLRDYSPGSIDCHPLKYGSCSKQMLRTVADKELEVPAASLRIAQFETIRNRLLSLGFVEQFADQYALIATPCRNRYMRYLYGLDGGEYIGIGPGARSHFGDVGFQNLRLSSRYSQAVWAGTRPIDKVARAPLRDNYVTCFPKRNDVLLFDDILQSTSSETIFETLGSLERAAFVCMDRGRYTLTEAGLPWYQNIQESLLSDPQQALHAETAKPRLDRFMDFHGYFDGLGAV